MSEKLFRLALHASRALDCFEKKFDGAVKRSHSCRSTDGRDLRLVALFSIRHDTEKKTRLEKNVRDYIISLKKTVSVDRTQKNRTNIARFK